MSWNSPFYFSWSKGIVVTFFQTRKVKMGEGGQHQGWARSVDQNRILFPVSPQNQLVKVNCADVAESLCVARAHVTCSKSSAAWWHCCCDSIASLGYSVMYAGFAAHWEPLTISNWFHFERHGLPNWPGNFCQNLHWTNLQVGIEPCPGLGTL